MKKKVPVLKADREAEAFLDQDLSDLDFSQFKVTHFEFEKKDGQINMRVPGTLLEVVKAQPPTRCSLYAPRLGNPGTTNDGAANDDPEVELGGQRISS